jgi:hypothetical protein
VGSRSPAPRPTASNVPTRVPAGPATEVRAPPGKGKERSQSRSCTTSTAWAPSRPGRATRPRERPPPGAARRRSPGHGGSSAATGLSWGSQPPTTRRRRHRRGRAAGRLHHHHRNARSRRRRGGLRHNNKLHCRGQHRSAQRRRHHHHHQGRRPRPCRREHPRRGATTRQPGSLPWERRIPRSPREVGCGLTSSKQFTHAFLCSIQFLSPNHVGVCQAPFSRHARCACW